MHVGLVVGVHALGHCPGWIERLVGSLKSIVLSTSTREAELKLTSTPVIMMGGLNQLRRGRSYLY